MWNFNRLSEKLKNRQDQIICRRCGLFHKKTLIACPNCGGLTDDEVKELVTRRAAFRLGLGRWMMIGAAIIFILMLFV